MSLFLVKIIISLPLASEQKFFIVYLFEQNSWKLLRHCSLLEESKVMPTTGSRQEGVRNSGLIALQSAKD